MPNSNLSGGVYSVQIAIDVLEAVAFSAEELGVTQIADRLKMTKGSVYRHLQTLVERGYLAQNPTTLRYSIGPKSRLLARHAPEQDLLHLAEGPMRQLRDAVDQTVVLSEMTPRGVLILHKLTASSPIEIGVRSGSELVFHASAQGKLMIALAPREVRDRVLAKPLQRFTDKTITSSRKLKQEFEQIVNRGYSSAPEEVAPGLNAVAAPIFDARGACVAALALVGSIQFLPERPKPFHVAQLLEASRQVSRKLGYSGAPNQSPTRQRTTRRRP
jgi:IclR family KDG regulon transcriptional repressor